MDPLTRWLGAMRFSDFDRAWRLSDQSLRETAIFPKHEGPRHLQKIWNGEPLENARVLVRCYHGLGDTLQFIRFVTPLRERAGQVIVWCQAELQCLVQRVHGVDRVLPLHDGTVAASFDVDIEVMELPHALRIAAKDLRKNVPYLAVLPESVPSTASDLRAGIIWQAGMWEPRRSIPREALQPLAAVKGVRFFSLHPGADLEGTPFTDWSSTSIHRCARRMATLNLVITVDTMWAHLAGALGLQTWTLLPSEADWRWGTGRRCAWYPTMRLFRQAVAGDWSQPILEAAGELSKLVRARTLERQPSSEASFVKGTYLARENDGHGTGADG